MVSMKVEKATAKGKKYKAIFYDDKGKKIKSTNFGDANAEDYTQHGDKERRDKYRARHKKDLQTGDPMRAGYLSYYILWGASKNINTNINSYKKMFKYK